MVDPEMDAPFSSIFERNGFATSSVRYVVASSSLCRKLLMPGVREWPLYWTSIVAFAS